MLGGRIVETGGPELATELHKQGYDRIRAAYPEAAAEEAAMAADGCELRKAAQHVRLTPSHPRQDDRWQAPSGCFNSER